MRAFLIVALFAVTAALWQPVPVVGQANFNGVCVAQGGFFQDIGGDNFDGCLDGVSEAQCLEDYCPVRGVGSGGNGFECFWAEGETCFDQPIDWDGTCQWEKGFCAFVNATNPVDSEILCGKGFNGEWFPAPSICGGGPVPTLPKAAYGVLALVLLAGTLTLLTLNSRG